jgi:hypothetical protein
MSLLIFVVGLGPKLPAAWRLGVPAGDRVCLPRALAIGAPVLSPAQGDICPPHPVGSSHETNGL